MYAPFKVFVLTFALAALSACSGLNVEKVGLQNPELPPENAQPSPVGFNKIRYAVPTGTPIMSHSPKGALGLLHCATPYGQIESGVSSRSFPNDDYRRVFLDTLEGQGYDVAGDPGRMFDEEEDMMRAIYSVGARITDIKMDLCRRLNMWSTYRGETGEATLTIEWTVYDLLNRKNAYKTVTKGYAVHKMPNYETIPLLLEKAFAAAVHNLGADEEFRNLIFFGNQPKEKPETIEDPEEQPITKYDAHERVSIDNAALSRQPAKGRFDDILKSAVMIEAGGGHGSGFFITRSGHILTNAHVVGNASRVRVVTSGKQDKLIAEVLRVDRKRDVALLKLEEPGALPAIRTLPVRLDTPAIGDDVYAIGAPRLKQLQDTITAGIVSAHRMERRTKQNFIQADVDIYGGNSGGPLLDEFGNVIGLSVSGFFIATDTLGGLNWFIPIDDALAALDIDIGGSLIAAKPQPLKLETLEPESLAPAAGDP